MSKTGATFIGQIYDIRTKKDGSGRLQLDFGADAIDEIQWVQKLSILRNLNFQVALIPLEPSVALSRHGVLTSVEGEDYEPDESGEIPLP